MSSKNIIKLLKHKLIAPILICLLFFVLYSTLSVVRHLNYQSFGFDLGINDQIVWEYSNFHTPITTIDHVVGIPKYWVHIESMYAFLSPFYWIYSSPLTLLVLQSFFVCSSALSIFLLAEKFKLNKWLKYALLISYLMFYGVQNALWFDAHSSTFETAFTAWFIYFLYAGKRKLSILAFVLAITGKENVAGITFLISGLYFITTRKREGIYFAASSLVYLLLVFGIYFPHFVNGGYRFQNSGGLLSHFNINLLWNTPEKLQVYFYSLFSFGFLSLLCPLFLIIPFANLAMYFILGAQNVTTAQGLFLQYRIELAPLLILGAVIGISKRPRFNSKTVAIFVLVCALTVQYLLHLPLSYLAKRWFWTAPASVSTINNVISDYLPKNASVVAQDNIIPHISERYSIYTLYPQKQSFTKNSPCGENSCDWFRWAGSPQFLLVDTATDWDTRHLLTNRDGFIRGLTNLEKAKIVQVYKRIGTTTLYKVNINPDDYR